jgi:hypothetical protein
MQHLRNAYRSLPAHGLVVLADRYLTDDGTKPLDRLVEHFVGSSFGLATRGDMVQAVKTCGFRAVRARKVYRDLWCIVCLDSAQIVGRAILPAAGFQPAGASFARRAGELKFAAAR